MIKTMFVLALVFVGIGTVNSKVPENESPPKDLYDAVPQDYRERLKQLVNQVIEFQKQRKWDKVYDLMSVPYRMESRDEFVRNHTRTSRLIDFEVSDVVHSPTTDNQWLVFGCAVFERNGKRKAWQSGITASLSDSKWSGSTVLISAGEHGGYTSCKTHHPSITPTAGSHATSEARGQPFSYIEGVPHP